MVEELTTRYLRTVDAALPGFVQMLYLAGSVALRAYQPGHSDIDTLIVTSRRPDDEDLAALARVHAAMPDRPCFDGIYLERADLVRQPADEPVVPFVVNGGFHTDRRCGELNPVLWLTMARYGVPVRGPAVAELGIATDVEVLRRWNVGNLRTYWVPLGAGLRDAVSGLADDDPVDSASVVWCVLGPARLHYTLARTDVISKSGAGSYLGEIFPAYAALAGRAVRWRAGDPVTFTAADARQAADAIDAVAADAGHRWG